MADFEAWETYAELQRAQDYTGLVAYCEREVARNPHDLHVADRLAGAYLQNDEFDKAIEFAGRIHRPNVTRLGSGVAETCIGYLRPKRKPRSIYDHWKWSAAVVDYALTSRCLHSVMGWSISLNGKANARALANWPVQTNGAEIMRLAVILTNDAGIKICCPVDDALLIESPLDQFELAIEKTQQCMQEAGEIVLNGFKLRTDVDRVKYPERYMDGRGVEMWKKVSELLEGVHVKGTASYPLTRGVGTR
jgi:hypothetical protein